ncbi:MAG: glycosyltransferase family 4 protein [Candidatus Pacebacteria bacterium]|nr:glycosyltransferase family 4 protein [Candidatus Paceibacterota bacterium]
MKLLILTQRVDKNDDVLGFFHDWIAEFAKRCEKVTVIALGVGEYDLPRNVKVLSLGKELSSQMSKVYKVESKKKYTFNFYRYIWSERNSYDNVFVHMNPEYVVLGGLFWRIMGKKIGLWYTHKSVDLKLRIAEKLTHTIFSASKESFRLKSKKLNIVGHGIDINKYICKSTSTRKEIDILCVGRISEIKNQKLLINAVDILVNQNKQRDLKVALIGTATLSKDKLYLDELKNFVNEKGLNNNIIFEGSVPNKDILKYYCKSKIAINLSPTGGLDKVVLESMAVGLPTIVLNKTFKNILPNNFIISDKNASVLAGKIKEILKEPVLQKQLTEKVKRDFSLQELITKVLNLYYAK